MRQHYTYRIAILALVALPVRANAEPAAEAAAQAPVAVSAPAATSAPVAATSASPPVAATSAPPPLVASAPDAATPATPPTPSSEPPAQPSESATFSTPLGTAVSDGALPLASAPQAQLEIPKPNQGHFIALGAYGVGAMAFDKYRGTRKPTFGPGFSLRLGEAVTDWLDLSLAFAMAETSGEAQDKFSLGRFGVLSQWYLNERWFIQAGFGATKGQGADPEDLKKNRGRYGDVYLTGVGVNLFISDGKKSGGWVLTPVATFEVGPDKTFTTTALWLGLEVSWWSGLTHDKLELPTSEAYTGRPQ